MSREKNLAKNTFIITVGKISTQLITFFLLPLYTGILSTEEYGTIDLVNTLVILMTPIITFQVEQGTFRMLVDARNNFFQQKEIITSSIISTIISIIVFTSVCLPISCWLGKSYWYFFILNVIATVECSLFMQIARGLDKNVIYAFSSFIVALLAIVFNVIFLVVFQMRINGMLLGTFLSQVLGSVYLFFRLDLMKYIGRKSLQKKRILELWKYSLPLVPNSISWWIFNSSDRIIVTAILGLSMNGILSASHKFSSLYITTYNIFNITWTESICIHINDKDIHDYYNRVFNTVLGLFFSIGMLIVSVMPFMYNILINSKYIDGYNLVPIHICASMFNIILGLIGTVYVAKKNTKAVAYTSLISAVINILVHICLIKFIGLYAAPLSTLIALAIMTFLRNKDISTRYFKIAYNRKLIASSIVCFTIIVATYYCDSTFLHIIVIILSLVYCTVWSKEIVMKGLSMIKEKRFFGRKK